MARYEEIVSFINAVELSSLSETARELNLSPSTISKQINNLEQHLGVRLLNRTTRSIAPTEAGELFYEQCRRAIADLEKAEANIRELQDEPQGVLRITAPEDFARLHLNQLFIEFARTYPKLNLELLFTDRTVDLLSEKVDVAIRIGNLADSSLVARRLGTCRRVVCASPEYLEARGIPQKPEDLRSHECVRYEFLEQTRGWRFEIDGKQRTIQPKGRFQADNGWIIKDLAVAGLAIGFLPTFLIGEELKSGRLVTILDDYLRADTEISAVYQSRANLSNKIRVFIDFLAERFHQHFSCV